MTKMINPDTNFFYIAFHEWKRENDCPLANYNELRLDDRSRIMIRAQELKNAFGELCGDQETELEITTRVKEREFKIREFAKLEIARSWEQRCIINEDDLVRFAERCVEAALSERRKSPA